MIKDTLNIINSKDSLYIQVSNRDIEYFLSKLPEKSTGLPGGQVALYAALIGASAAILSQVIIYFLNQRKEKINLKRELISEERRLAYFLSELYKELVMHKVHKQYWYKTSEVLISDEADRKDSHERHFISNQKSFESLSKIRIATSEYIKIVNHFMTITSYEDAIISKIDEIKNFVPRKASSFDDVTSYSQLLEVRFEEENALNLEYSFYSKCYNQINIIMNTKL